MKRRFYFIVGVLITVTLSGCTGSRRNIEEALSDITDPHPTENLNDFYEIEGFRDESFDENDQGVWVLNTSMAILNDDEVYVEEGMFLWINRNTKTAEGHYFINEFSRTNPTKNTTFNVKLVDNKLILLTDANDSIKEKVNDFKFGVQYLDFQTEYLNSLSTEKVTYIPEIPLFSISYELEKEDKNLQNILKQYAKYDIPLSDNPILYIDGSGEREGEYKGRRNLRISLNREEQIMYISEVMYVSDNGER